MFGTMELKMHSSMINVVVQACILCVMGCIRRPMFACVWALAFGHLLADLWSLCFVHGPPYVKACA